MGIGTSEEPFMYSLIGDIGSKDCQILKNANLKKGKTYKMKIDNIECNEDMC